MKPSRHMILSLFLLCMIFGFIACGPSIPRAECYQNVRDDFEETTNNCKSEDCIDAASALQSVQLKECK